MSLSSVKPGRGVLIDNTCICGFATAPFAAAYAASTFALRGFCDSLRQELVDWPDVHACTA
ncbi:MAG TPA: hypothetical protein VFO41_02510 [Alphaproteobacteria bacterium]|nr:hypothetical protein [Alphaproteobacteria bacterium]